MCLLLTGCLFPCRGTAGSSPQFRLDGAEEGRLLHVPASLLPPGGDTTRYGAVSWYFAQCPDGRLLSLRSIEPVAFEDRGYCDTLYASWLRQQEQHDTLRAIWFSGVLDQLVQPVSGSQGEWLSPYLYRYQVESGLLRTRQALDAEGFFLKRRHTARGYRAVLDGHWNEQLAYEVSLFADSVNVLTASASRQASDSVFVLSFRYDGQGRLSARVCAPRVLTDRDLTLLDGLQQALGNLPPHALTDFYTSADSLCGERVMKGYCTETGGWVFCDRFQPGYASFDRPPHTLSGTLVALIAGTVLLLVVVGIVTVRRIHKQRPL